MLQLRPHPARRQQHQQQLKSLDNYSSRCPSLGASRDVYRRQQHDPRTHCSFLVAAENVIDDDDDDAGSYWQWRYYRRTGVRVERPQRPRISNQNADQDDVG